MRFLELTSSVFILFCFVFRGPLLLVFPIGVECLPPSVRHFLWEFVLRNFIMIQLALYNSVTFSKFAQMCGRITFSLLGCAPAALSICFCDRSYQMLVDQGFFF